MGLSNVGYQYSPLTHLVAYCNRGKVLIAYYQSITIVQNFLCNSLALFVIQIIPQDPLEYMLKLPGFDNEFIRLVKKVIIGSIGLSCYYITLLSALHDPSFCLTGIS